jgi:hypothetical protein
VILSTNKKEEKMMGGDVNLGKMKTDLCPGFVGVEVRGRQPRVRTSTWVEGRVKDQAVARDEGIIQQGLCHILVVIESKAEFVCPETESKERKTNC